jgi:hypothetical protein
MKPIFSLRQLPQFRNSSIAERFKIIETIQKEALPGWRSHVAGAITVTIGFSFIKVLHLYVLEPLVTVVFAISLILLAHLIQLNLCVKYARKRKPELLQIQKIV